MEEKRNFKKDKKLILSFGLLSIIMIVGFIYFMFFNGNVQNHINKEDIDIKLYVDIADEVGNNEYQLNWREMVAIAGVVSNNHLKTLDNNDIINIANLFIDHENNKLKTYAEVSNSVANLISSSHSNNKLVKEKYLRKANIYLKDLDTFGYMPEKYVDDSREMKFINSIKEGAIENYRKYKILPSITIAQAILESSWGESQLTTTANNLFGIKADTSWKGESVNFKTKEYNDTYIYDNFRKYDDLKSSIDDHADFLVKNSRYKEAGVFQAKTYKEQAKKLQEAGYSTAEDENGNKIYDDMLITIIRQYNLQLIDHQVMIQDN